MLPNGSYVMTASVSAVRRRPDEDAARWRGDLQARRGVHDVAHRGVVAAGSQRADEHLTGADPDAQLDRALHPARVIGDRLLHAQRRPHGALGIVLVRDRGAEQGDDAVPQDLVDPAAKGIDVLHQPFEAGVDHPFDLLRIAVLGQCRVADDVGEQHGDDAPLLELLR